MSLSAQLFGRDSTIFKINNFMLGGGPGLIDSAYRKLFPEAKTPSPTIPTVQDSAYGNPIPHFYAMYGTSGNVIWLKGGKLDYTVKKKKSGGKGGGSSSAQPVYSYFATFALALGEGEISGIRRIWCSDKLIYNAGSDDLETIVASNQSAKGWVLYRGTDDQLPDPDMQADKGVENTPAYRGLAYIKFKRFALKNYGDSLAGSQFKVEVVRANSFEVIASEGPSLNFATWRDVAVSASAFCAIATSVAYVGISYDGKTWRQVALPETSTWRSIGYGAPGFVILSQSGRGAFSSTGEAWVSFALPVSAEFVRVAWSGVSYATVAANTAVAMVSPDGRTWVSKSLPASRNWSGIAYGAGKYIAVALLTNKYAVSYDEGETWVEKTLPITGSFSGVAYNDEVFCIITSGNSNFLVSEDGETWTAVPAPGGATLRDWLDISADSGVFALADGTSSQPTNYVGFSGDGVNWDLDVVQHETWQGVANIGNSMVAVAPGLRSVCAVRRVSPDSETLADVISAEVSLTNLLGPADIDVSMLTQSVRGYKVVGGSPRSVIEELQSAYRFDVRMHGYSIQFVPRGQASAVSIPWGDLAATDGDEIGDSLPYTREMDSQLPQKITVSGVSADREYASSSQYYERIGTNAVNSESVDLGLVLTDDEEAQIAEVLCELRWLERDEFSFDLPPTYQALEPADVVTASAKFGTFDLRLTEVSSQANGIVSCKAFPNSIGLYTSVAVGAPAPGPDGTIGVEGPTFMALVDGPMIYEDVQNAPGFSTAAAGYTGGWPGAVLVRSNDQGQTWVDLQGYDAPGTVGTCRDSLAVNSGALFDLGGSLRVDMIAGELESITESQMLEGGNMALYGADGRWEVIRFQNATLQTDGSYILTKFVRGDKGTEWATGLHVAGDVLVMAADPDNAFVGSPVESIGLQRTYRAVTSGASIDTAADLSLTYRGVNLKPLSPAYPFGSRNSSSDLAVSFTRRSRFSSSWWITGVPAPVGEASEAYQVDVMSGSTVKRTISITSPSFTYTAADQTTDFGSPQTSITLRIYQVSATVGRGYPLEVIL